MMKIGRRGSVNMWITIKGFQGHVAYPHLAMNPISPLVRILSAIEALTLDEGTDWFQPSNIEITDLEVGNPATNVIPSEAKARISRSEEHTSELQSLMRISYAVFCLKKKNKQDTTRDTVRQYTVSTNNLYEEEL